MSDSAAPTWADQVKKVVSERAWIFNYEIGMQCRFMPVKSEQGAHTIEILMETTHLGHPFDLQWFVKHGDDPSAGIRFELVAPADKGGLLWQDDFDALDRLRADAEALPIFIKGYFVGRNSVAAAPAEQAT